MNHAKESETDVIEFWIFIVLNLIDLKVRYKRFESKTFLSYFIVLIKFSCRYNPNLKVLLSFISLTCHTFLSAKDDSISNESSYFTVDECVSEWRGNQLAGSMCPLQFHSINNFWEFYLVWHSSLRMWLQILKSHYLRCCKSLRQSVCYTSP